MSPRLLSHVTYPLTTSNETGGYLLRTEDVGLGIATVRQPSRPISLGSPGGRVVAGTCCWNSSGGCYCMYMNFILLDVNISELLVRGTKGDA